MRARGLTVACRGQVREPTPSVSASVGGGLFPEDGASATELVRRADAAMYNDKARNRRLRAGAA